MKNESNTFYKCTATFRKHCILHNLHHVKKCKTIIRAARLGSAFSWTPCRLLRFVLMYFQGLILKRFAEIQLMFTTQLMPTNSDKQPTLDTHT
jgi:hypothetical protein